MSDIASSILPPSLRLGRAHWLVLAASLALTLAAWWFTAHQQTEKQRQRFDSEAVDLVEDLRKRMANYDGALLAGVAYMQARNPHEPIDRAEWEVFAKTLQIHTRFPGILGIGIIEQVADADRFRHRERLRSLYPDIEAVDIHPRLSREQHLPITLLYPLEPNRAAIGLDIAFEENRRTAALAALAEGRPRISGPIQLVQDRLSRPGFLFYEPFVVTAPDRDGRRYTGLVYAPFVVADLIEGTLQPSRRNVTFSLRDGDQLLYGDSAATTSTFDAYPMFESVITLPMYGREWTFHIASGRPYREGALTSLPGLILLGGLSVNLLLMAFFGLLVQSSRAAQERAAHASVQHERAQRELLQRNEELVQFNYRVSHDLVAPMRSISGLLDILRLDLEDKEYGNVEQAVAQMQTEVTKQIRVISSIFRLSEADLREEEYRWFAVRPLAIELFETATRDEQATDVALRLQVPDDFYVYAPESRLRLALGNIISNAVRFRREGEQQPRVDVRAEMSGNEYVIRVRDNGIGIPAELQPKVFDLFFRAHSHAKSGTGLGAYIARKSLERMDGEIEVFSDAEGSAFELRWPHPAGAASAPPPISSGEPTL